MADKARDLFRRTMWVLATNVLSRGITDSAIACGAALALAVGAWRVEAGAMDLPELLVIMMLGVEIFRPMRELRNVLHQGMVGMSAAKGVYHLLDGEPAVVDSPHNPAADSLEPSVAFETVGFRYPGARRVVHDGSISPSPPASGSGSSGRAVAASPLLSVCCCVSSTPNRAA
ncbi:MAG: hypothetical protein ACMVO3_19955 [Thalassobaculum sp.]